MARTLDRSLDLLRVPANALSFMARSRLRWTRGIASLGNETKDDQFAWLPTPQRDQAIELAAEFSARFDLRELHGRSSRLHWYENLAMLEALERLAGHLALPLGSDGVLRAIDVGCGAFQYATAMQRFLARGGAGLRRQVVLRGIEVDGHGIYRDGHSRADHARAHAELAGDGVFFQVADFTALRLPEQDVVTMWFPFLERRALLRWGLPLSLFHPRQLVARASATLRPGGLLVVANQTPAEFEVLRAQCAHQPLELLREVTLATQLVPYHERTEHRVGSVWRRRD